MTPHCVLSGKENEFDLIFGTDEGRELLFQLYGDLPLNKAAFKHISGFLHELINKLPKNAGTIRILRMGAGSGGITKWLLPRLADLDYRIEYTLNDLAASFITSARRRFRSYPFEKFRQHDMENNPAEDLVGTQHLVIVSNALHNTRDLTQSARNIRKFLRPDGALILVEMTRPAYWLDMIFGLFPGWWSFTDGRVHAIADEVQWKCKLQDAGFEYVDWTDGLHTEVKAQRIIIALPSKPQSGQSPVISDAHLLEQTVSNCPRRREVINDLIYNEIADFTVNIIPAIASVPSPSGKCVLVTGATGSLGSHLVARLAQLPDIETVICLNQQKATEPLSRQREAMELRGICVNAETFSKIEVIETNTSKPFLGLPSEVYDNLLWRVTHIIHNAWPMNAQRPLAGFQMQFRIMRNLIDFARDISCQCKQFDKVTFQFISSISAVGCYRVDTKNPNIPEAPVDITSVPPLGYGEAKYICEKMLEETLHRYEDRFRTMVVRLNQVSGSRGSGYWNPTEHIPYVVKSAQTLKLLPDFKGVVSWMPVDDVAAILGDLLVSDDTSCLIYHIESPVKKPWSNILTSLAAALDVPHHNIVPFQEWQQHVRDYSGSPEKNPTVKLLDSLELGLMRMMCGELQLETTNTQLLSKRLRFVEPVSAELVRRYVEAWRTMRFLT